MPTDDAECPFCRIVAGEDEAAKEVFRDDHVIAFFPLEPATPGHTLVVPRRHVPDLWSLDDQTVGYLTDSVVKVAGAVNRAVSPQGLNIIQSNGAAASQTVMHLHVHVLPRWDGDAVGEIWPESSTVTDEQKDQVWQQVRVECAREPAVIAPTSPEDRRKHLELIQAVVTRMSAASTTTKGWLLPVVTAAYGYAVTKSSAAVALLGLAAVLLAGLIDANYLKQERAFRRLYDAVVRGADIPSFSMNTSLAVTESTPETRCGCGMCRAWSAVCGWVPGVFVWLSWAIAPFYGALAAIGVWIYFHAR
jgi:diadenosine tetraphosphate (Ap4A) HIT family hydrolase